MADSQLKCDRNVAVQAIEAPDFKETGGRGKDGAICRMTLDALIDERHVVIRQLQHLEQRKVFHDLMAEFERQRHEMLNRDREVRMAR